MRTECQPYEWWINKIQDGKPFTLIRIGDGEWNAVEWTSRKKGGGRTKNGDGHTLRSLKMRKQLIKSIIQPGQATNYYRGLWMDADCQPVERLARRWIPKHAPSLLWHDGLAIHFANVEGRNYPYFQAMRNLKMPIVVIGPKHLRKLPKVGVFGYRGFVEVPYHSAFFDCERIVDEALAFEPPVFYSIHAGPPSPIFAWRLWKERGDSCIVMDLGSILDGYCGVKTRKFWKKRCTPDIIRRNLRGKRWNYQLKKNN